MSPKRLVLFDIDGTLLRGGPMWKESFFRAFNDFFPHIHLENVPFSGKTDLQICRELMAQAGLESSEVEVMMGQIASRYIDIVLTKVPERAHEVQLLPGAREIVEKLATHPEVFLGLLTGNLAQGAKAKLDCVQLTHHFRMGVYGDDHWDRYKLPPIAVSRVKEKFGLQFSGKQIVIIGDTIHDVNCGKSIGVRSIAVGTGRGVSHDDLLMQNPDYFFKDMSEIDDVVNAILEDLAD